MLLAGTIRTNRTDGMWHEELDTTSASNLEI